MKFLDILRKLGIYRSGVISYKGDASKRPMEFIDSGIMNKDKDYSTTKDLYPGGMLANILGWIFGGTLSILGFFMLFSDFFSGIVFLFVGMLVMPASSAFISKKMNYNPTRKQKVLAVIIGFIISSLLMSPTKTPDASFELTIRDGNATEEGMETLANALDDLVRKYKAASEYQKSAAAIPYGSITAEDARLIAAEASRFWEEVELSADNLGNLTFPTNTNEKVGFRIIKKAFAQDMPDPSKEFGKRLTESDLQKLSDKKQEANARQAEIDLIERKWKQADLARLAYPNKRWLEIVQTAFKVDAGKAKEIMNKRNADLQVEFKNEDDYNKRWVQAITVVDTAGKVVLFTTAAPAAIATGGAVVAGETFLAGVGLAFSVGDTVNVMVNDGKEDIMFTEAKNAVAPILLAADLKSVLTEPKIASLLNVLVPTAEVSGKLGGTTVLDWSGSDPKVKYYSVPIPATKEEIEAFKKMTKEEQEKKIQESAMKLAKEIKNPAYRKSLEDEQARKDTAIKQIIERKEQERAQKAVQESAEKELKAIESILSEDEKIAPKLETPTEKPEPVTVPAPTPTTPKVEVNTVVGSCKTCFDSGLDCACGRETCMCCAPGADCWPN